MHHPNHPKGAFTLVEIMIVVVIIGLLAALAIPAWQRVRLRSLQVRMDNDARQLASAAQQYFMENSLTQVDVVIGFDGQVTGELQRYVRQVSPGYTGVSNPFQLETSFTMQHQLLGAAVVAYTAEGLREP